ncbi:hypothetical protein JTB14_002433 [Gonioctena quinquepunctata]|nr:hypothetical protein JTB14_002433 [Gonioctena quinquepunctata]
MHFPMVSRGSTCNPTTENNPAGPASGTVMSQNAWYGNVRIQGMIELVAQPMMEYSSSNRPVVRINVGLSWFTINHVQNRYKMKSHEECFRTGFHSSETNISIQKYFSKFGF